MKKLFKVLSPTLISIVAGIVSGLITGDKKVGILTFFGVVLCYTFGFAKYIGL